MFQHLALQELSNSRRQASTEHVSLQAQDLANLLLLPMSLTSMLGSLACKSPSFPLLLQASVRASVVAHADLKALIPMLASL